MGVELRQLRCLVALNDAGTFTDAAIDLNMSQAAVSRNVAALEETLGVRLVQRTTRSVRLTPAGERTVRHARQALSVLELLERDARTGRNSIRIGYAWSALGKHTVEFQRRWAAAFPNIEVLLVRTNSSTAGLAEGRSDFAILRRVPDTAAYDVVLVGLEKRYCAMAADDPLAAKRSVSLAQVAGRPLALDARTGSTGLDLWPDGERPRHVVQIDDIDDWLTVIGSGRARGISAESTAHQYRRRGVVYRPVRDAPPVPVYLAWSRTDPPRERTEVIGLLAGLYA
ncbi:LysR family transcriptional regulator [Arthrobacter pascens]|uniref:LysR family transcriptional regulator n=1 Tax=Arthrobacter pascens TaxID=1677 RepID=UPI00196B9B76|nr:LysR family transcriptional regulator [Arthrobacter pascens]MBN3499450.1 LysR family transcriptional regulator [Arthrobacter pascens]